MEFRKYGILLQGPISDWTENIIKNYQKNFSFANIVLSTWKNEKIKNVKCEVVQSDVPEPTKPYTSTVNHQIVGTKAGLQKINSKIIMKTRTDQLIQNKNIFKIFEDSCPHEKIMIPNYSTRDYINYYATDFCQTATKETLENFWNSIKFYDGSFTLINPEIYLTANYIIREKNDFSSWKNCLKRYFYIKSYHDDFQIKWEKLLKLLRRKLLVIMHVLVFIILKKVNTLLKL